MKFFRQRESTIENLTFMGLASALVAIFSLASSFSVIASLALMLVLPLISALVALICRWRYIPLYLLASVLLSTLLSFASFQNEILFVLPSLITGLVYGMLEKSKAPRSLSLFLSSILEVALFYLSVLLIKAFYEIDMIQFLLTMVGKQNDANSLVIVPSFVLAYGFAQVAVSHIVFVFAFSRFDLKDKVDLLDQYYWIIGLSLWAIGFGLLFLNASIGYFCIGLSLYWTIFASLSIFRKPAQIPVILLFLGVLVAWLISAAFYRYMPNVTGMALYTSYLVFVNLASFLNDLLLRKKNKSKMNIQ